MTEDHNVVTSYTVVDENSTVHAFDAPRAPGWGVEFRLRGSEVGGGPVNLTIRMHGAQWRRLVALVDAAEVRHLADTITNFNNNSKENSHG